MSAAIAAPGGQAPESAPLDEITLESAALSIDLIEHETQVIAGSVTVHGDCPDENQKRFHEKNPGTRDIYGGLVADAILVASYPSLIHRGRKIRETVYDRDHEWNRLTYDWPGLHSFSSDHITVIGYGRGFTNYYHWMAQCLPAIYNGVTRFGSERCIIAAPPISSFQEESLSLLGFSEVRRYEIDPKENYYLPLAYFSEFLSGKTAFALSLKSKQVFDRIAASVDQPSNTPELIYVSRSDGRNRPIGNEPEIQAWLENQGFVTVVPGKLTVCEQVRTFRGARVVVGVHGAGMTNVAFCRSGTRVLEFIQSGYPNACMNRLAQTQQLDYHSEFVHCIVPPGQDLHKFQWDLDIDRVCNRLRDLLR